MYGIDDIGWSWIVRWTTKAVNVNFKLRSNASLILHADNVLGSEFTKPPPCLVNLVTAISNTKDREVGSTGKMQDHTSP